MGGDSVTAIAESVAEILRQRIIKGEIKPGDRIVERTLCKELDVSRTPIREALKLLSVDGVIEISRNKGARAKGYTEEEALELFDVIAVLESLAAERLAESIITETLADLEGLHARMLAFLRAGDVERYFDANSEIHDMIVAKAGSQTLVDAHQRLMVRAKRGRFLAVMEPERLNQAKTEHEELMVALRNKDRVAAGAIWRTHLLHTGETVAEVLRRHHDRGG